MKLGRPLADIFRLLPENINSGEIGGTDNNRNLVRKSSMIRTDLFDRSLPTTEKTTKLRSFLH